MSIQYKLLLITSLLAFFVSANLTSDSSLQIIVGFVSMIAKDIDYESIRSCAENVEYIIPDLRQVLSDLSSQNQAGYKQAIIDYGNVALAIPDILKKCPKAKESMV